MKGNLISFVSEGGNRTKPLEREREVVGRWVEVEVEGDVSVLPVCKPASSVCAADTCRSLEQRVAPSSGVKAPDSYTRRG